MDIIDIVLARALTPQGQIETYSNMAQQAVTKANTAVSNIESITEQTNTNNTNAKQALQDAEAAREAVEEALGTLEDLDTSMNNKIDDFNLSYTGTTGNTARTMKLTAEYPSGKRQVFDSVVKYYRQPGQNEDGTMTQKAITDMRDNLQTQIDAIPSGGGGGSTNLGPENAGSIVVVGDDGNITSGDVTEEDIIKTEIAAGTYQNSDVVGLEIDYVNKTFTRLQGAVNLTPGTNFNRFKMYGGRKRCLVDETGAIIRFLGASETLSGLANKRVMVYQPAFYYMRTPTSTITSGNGTKIQKEQIYLSDIARAGFKLHPAFYDANNNPVKFILIPAFESGTMRANGTFETEDSQDIDFSTDKLISMVNTKPISGATQSFTYSAAQTMARNNGEGWDLTNLEFESVNQMLMLVEYGSLNLQNTFNQGLTAIVDVGGNISSITGSTISLGNNSGQATSTYNTRTTSYSESGKCAISYRGLENPYGNSWRFIRDLTSQNSNILYKGQTLSFKLPTGAGWINGFGYDQNNDWIFLPIEINGTANSSLPVGDYLIGGSGSTVTVGITGGLSSSGENCGPFYYAFNIAKEGYHYRSDSARVMFTPTANSTVETNNFNLWLNS